MKLIIINIFSLIEIAISDLNFNIRYIIQFENFKTNLNWYFRKTIKKSL